MTKVHLAPASLADALREVAEEVRQLSGYPYDEDVTSQHTSTKIFAYGYAIGMILTAASHREVQEEEWRQQAEKAQAMLIDRNSNDR